MEHQSAMKTHELEMGLPLMEDLIPLTQSLITPELAVAFGVNPEPSRTLLDLNKAMHDTYSTICHREEDSSNFEPPLSLRLFPTTAAKPKRAESGGPAKEEPDGPGRAVKRPRLVWTPQLHQRFVDVIENLGVDKAVPKTIMEMMNVEGLTRENVASHLQKYRLYLKRMDGLSGESHSNSRRVPSLMDYDGFGSCPMSVPQQHCNSLSSLMPMPMVGPYGFGHLGFAAGSSASSGYCGLESGPSNMFWNQQRG